MLDRFRKFGNRLLRAIRLHNAGSYQSQTLQNRIAMFRTWCAQRWRRLVRISVVLTGVAFFASAQIWLAQMIVDDKWYFVLELLISFASLTLMIIKPMYALVLWILFSPLVSRLFSLDWGSGLPALTFNRSVIYPLAIILFIRGLGRRTKIRNLKVGEWLLLLFPFYILCTEPFFQYHSITT